MDMESKTDKVNESLANWSKWLIGVNLFSAVGCVVALKTADYISAKVGLFFFIAILSFGLSIVCSTLFVFLIAKQGLKSGDGNKTVKIIWLAKLQWILFALGLVFVLVWIGWLSKVF
jgi:hypothetical protein